MPATPTATFDRSSRLKAKDGDAVGWPSLLQKFREVQDRANRAKPTTPPPDAPPFGMMHPNMEQHSFDTASNEAPKFTLSQPPPTRTILPEGAASGSAASKPDAAKHKGKGGLSNFGKFARGVGQKGGKK